MVNFRASNPKFIRKKWINNRSNQSHRIMNRRTKKSQKKKGYIIKRTMKRVRIRRRKRRKRIRRRIRRGKMMEMNRFKQRR